MAARRRHARRLLPGLFVCTALVLLAACTGSPATDRPTSSTSPTSPSASPTGPVTLRFGVYGDEHTVSAYRQLAAAFTAAHPQVTIRIETASDSAAALDRLQVEFTKDRAPDVFLMDHDDVPQLVADDRVQPVDELLEERGVQFGDTFERLGLESMGSDSSLQCMPNEVSPYVVFYNRQLLPPRLRADPRQPQAEPLPPEAGWTWDAFTSAARTVSTGRVRGVYLPPRLTTLVPLVRSDGSDLMDDPRKPTTLTFADGSARASLEKVLALARDPSVSPTPAMLARQDALTRFENGSLAMMIGTRALVPQLRQHPALRFDVLPLPRLGSAQTVADVSGYCIDKGSEHVAQAADFIAFASQDRGASIMAESGGIVPANLAVLHSDAFTQPGSFPVNAAVFPESLRHADTMPFTTAWPQVVAQTQPFLDRLFTAPDPDLDTLLPHIDELSASLLAPPSASPSP
jgi:multiple sugar transport system substrate-binding protein